MRNRAHADRTGVNRVVHSHRSQYKWSHIGCSEGESEKSVLYGVETSCFQALFSAIQQVASTNTINFQQQPESAPARSKRPWSFSCCNATPPTALLRILWSSKIPDLKLVDAILGVACSFLNSCPLTLSAQTATDWCLQRSVTEYCWLRCLSQEGTAARACFCEKSRHFEHLQ